MIGVDADDYGHSLARTYTLTTHTLHTHSSQQLVESEMAPPQNKGTHNPHCTLTTHSYTV